MRVLALLLVLGLSGCLAAPADLQKLERLKEKLTSLHEVLDELNKNIEDLEAKREFASTPAPVDQPDAELQSFLDGLSSEDKELVEKMKSKLGFLQATVHEEPGVDIPAEDGYAEEQPAEEPAEEEAEEPAEEEAEEEKRDMTPELENLYEHMSQEDKELLKDHPSMWSHLSKALKTPGGNAADTLAQAEDKRQLVNELSDEDQELLRRMRSKLGTLKTALRSQKSQASEGQFGAFEARGEDRGWHDGPAECEGTDCHDNPPEAVDEVQTRLLNDVRYAKENGVSLKDVLRVLIEAKNKA